MKSLLGALVLAAGAAHAADPGKTFVYMLKPGDIEEECVRLEKGDKRDYQWRADVAVDFNIHYHRGNDVFFPVKGDGVLAGHGTFTAEADEHYCWMWTGLDRAARVEASIK